MRKIKLFTLLAAALMTANMWADSGSFGAGLTWDYNEGTGALTITGSGAMPDYTSFTGANPAPWSSYILDITSVTLQSGLTKIGDYAFYFCKNDALTSIEIPSTVTSIGQSAFGNCVNVSSFEIPAGVTSIGSAAFSFCTSLTSVTFTRSIPCTLPANAFYNSNNFAKIYVPAAYGQAYYNAWSDFVDYLYEAETGDKIEYVPVYTPCGGGLGWDYHNHVLTFNYDGVGTGVMNNYTRTGTTRAPWYSNRYDITSVVLPEGLTHIGDYAFYSLSGLTNTVALPSTLTSIGEYAFNGTNITSISLPSGMTTVGINAFNLCSKLASVTIPSSVTSIGANAFAGTKIASINLPDGLTSIGEGAFQSDHALESIVIPANVTEIGLSAFSYCTNLTSVTCLPTTAPTVGNNAFIGCPENLIITFQDGVNEQAYANNFLQAWDHLRNATTGVQPVTPHLHGVFGDANLEWDLSFTGSGTLMEHEGTLAITGEGAMDDYDWTNNVWAPWMTYADFINHVNIGNKVTKIGESAFAYMKHVNTFIIPASVTYIGGDAFMECDNTEMIVYCYANPANLEWHDNVSEYEGEGWVPDDFLTLTRNAWGNYEWHVQATKCVVPSNYLEGYKAKWARGGDYKWWDLNVWFTSELQDGETEEYITNALNALDGKTAPVVTLVRPLNRDGYFATLCLPFDMSAEQLAESSLHGAEIKEFTNASVEAGTINIEFTPVDHIVAGKPYFIKYEDAEVMGDALDRLDFMNVTIDKTAPVAVTHNGVTMTGTFVPKYVQAQTSPSDGDGVLFLGPSNTLYWPSAAGNIKPFRAYFSVAGGALGAPRRGMPVRIVERENMPTALEAIQKDVQFNKTIENGMLVIEKNGVRYNAQGQIVK